MTINLNADDYEGGDLRFPEYGPRTYRAPTGGAIVFSCSLLHEATPVTKGRRFAFLPFLYDEDGAQAARGQQPASGRGRRQLPGWAARRRTDGGRSRRHLMIRAPPRDQ